jgi:hypothetical protein
MVLIDYKFWYPIIPKCSNPDHGIYVPHPHILKSSNPQLLKYQKHDGGAMLQCFIHVHTDFYMKNGVFWVVTPCGSCYTDFYENQLSLKTLLMEDTSYFRRCIMNIGPSTDGKLYCKLFSTHSVGDTILSPTLWCISIQEDYSAPKWTGITPQLWLHSRLVWALTLPITGKSRGGIKS